MPSRAPKGEAESSVFANWLSWSDFRQVACSCTIRITSNAPGIQFDVSGDNGKDRIELEGTWTKVRVYGGNGTDTLKNRGIGSIEISGIELEI